MTALSGRPVTASVPQQQDVVQAESLIRARLEVTPGEARLWCALGDLNLDDSCYHQAWELSVGASPALPVKLPPPPSSYSLLCSIKCLGRPIRRFAEYCLGSLSIARPLGKGAHMDAVCDRCPRKTHTQHRKPMHHAWSDGGLVRRHDHGLRMSDDGKDLGLR